ncbi:alpha/beta fold hydrolase [Mucilaginibacter sp. OK098]|uniref:alpha/beta fold hydrolase n=1 Tax=Mucilaginibacter sp. OK098 TaxID=1855297 RepID=UPI00091D0F38|nr:alpha/beta hydrolase [Mucilaginibacter sp. OK098]SHN37421.1 Alpha/beta hydrolase family protein [Mucilaginibacter sp. OK098]
MKKLKQIITQTKEIAAANSAGFNDLVWQLICYSPKMQVRLQQEQLLNEAEHFSLKVNDDYFAKKQLTFNGFKWGNGKHKILITHGWGSKAADFGDIITALREIGDVEIIAFDAPGNGSSEAELSNLLLFILAAEAIIKAYGKPDVLIGHSLGAMANVMAIKETEIAPSLLVSLTPLVRLKENFEASMNAAGVQQPAQDEFLESFEVLFGYPASYYNLNRQYLFDIEPNHWLAYDNADLVAPYPYLQEFLNAHPSVNARHYEGTGQERILKSPEMIVDLVKEVKIALEK